MRRLISVLGAGSLALLLVFTAAVGLPSVQADHPGQAVQQTAGSDGSKGGFGG